MHEATIAQELLDRVESEARQRAAHVVHAVHVRLGAASGVEGELLRRAFELCRPGTVCAAAVLRFEVTPEAWRCRACGRALAPGALLACSDCGGRAELASGDEIVLARIEMEVD